MAFDPRRFTATVGMAKEEGASNSWSQWGKLLGLQSLLAFTGCLRFSKLAQLRCVMSPFPLVRWCLSLQPISTGKETMFQYLDWG